MPCVWCNEGKCRNAGDEFTCEFKTLERTPEGIKQRINEENDKVMNLMKSDIEDYETLQKIKSEVNDRLQGVKIMKDALEADFKMSYNSRNQLEMTQVLINFIAKGKRLERKLKNAPRR